MNNVKLDLFDFLSGFKNPENDIAHAGYFNSSVSPQIIKSLVFFVVLINNKVVNLKFDNIYKIVVVDKKAYFYLSGFFNLVMGFIHFTVNKKLIAQCYCFFNVLLKINQQLINFEPPKLINKPIDNPIARNNN